MGLVFKLTTRFHLHYSLWITADLLTSFLAATLFIMRPQEIIVFILSLLFAPVAGEGRIAIDRHSCSECLWSPIRGLKPPD